MRSTHDLLGPMRELAHIRPPEGSYWDWERFVEECREAGLAAVTAGRKDFSESPLGYALLRRWRWLKDSQAAGIPYEEATVAFDAAIERERDAIRANLREQAKTTAKAIAEREGSAKKAARERNATDLLDYGDGRNR